MPEDLAVGTKVRRGPTWRWGDQDGGEGMLGQVLKFKKEGVCKDGSHFTVNVAWDYGHKNNYRYNEQFTDVIPVKARPLKDYL